MRIKQCCISEYQRKTFNGFMKRYSISVYRDKKSPAIFYSLWGVRDLLSHRSLAVIIWRGTDIVKIGVNKIKKIKRMKNVYHIAISSYIMKDLDNFGISYKFIPIVGADVNKFKPELLGDEIYTYLPNINNPKVSDKYKKRYNYNLINEIKDKCRFKINIISRENHYSRKKIRQVYKRCFCGLRLTKHDGLPNQVIEMGLMGRRSFYNGDIPGSIEWDKKDVKKIIANIENESKKIGQINYKLANKITEFIDVGENWLHTEFWEK